MPTHTISGRPSKWPIIWGVVAIVFGTLGIMSGLFKVIQSAMMMIMPMGQFYDVESFPKSGNPEQDKMMEDMIVQQQEVLTKIQEIAPIVIGTALVLIILAVGLLVGGILLCMRKRSLRLFFRFGVS